LATLLLLFGAYALVDGIVGLIGVFIQAQAGRRWVLALHGLAGTAAGLLSLGWPGFTALALLYLVAAWALLVGISTILAAIELRKAIEGEWLLGLSGAAALLFGVGIAAYPAAATLALLALIAAYAILTGIMQIALGLRLRRLRTSREQAAARA
jgi:uncharacterized membrane protein HdeD (DUF308 family)